MEKDIYKHSVSYIHQSKKVILEGEVNKDGSISLTFLKSNFFDSKKDSEKITVPKGDGFRFTHEYDVSQELLNMIKCLTDGIKSKGISHDEAAPKDRIIAKEMRRKERYKKGVRRMIKELRDVKNKLKGQRALNNEQESLIKKFSEENKELKRLNDDHEETILTWKQCSNNAHTKVRELDNKNTRLEIKNEKLRRRVIDDECLIKKLQKANDINTRIVDAAEKSRESMDCLSNAFGKTLNCRCIMDSEGEKKRLQDSGIKGAEAGKKLADDFKKIDPNKVKVTIDGKDLVDYLKEYFKSIGIEVKE